MSMSLTPSGSNPSIRRFGDCALVEIIHLHDCLRNALGDLQKDVTELSRVTTCSFGPSLVSTSTSTSTSSSSAAAAAATTSSNKRQRVEDLERRIASRFRVIWSVFKAHSAAEDEFIWPALKEKLNKNKKNEEKKEAILITDHQEDSHVGQRVEINQNHEASVAQSNSIPHGNFVHTASHEECVSDGQNTSRTPVHRTSQDAALSHQSGEQSTAIIIEQEEYEEDHADEERMFLEMDSLLEKLRDGLYSRKRNSISVKSTSQSPPPPEKKMPAHKSDHVAAFLSDTKTKLPSTTTSSNILGNLQINSKNHQPQKEEVKQISQSLKDKTTMLSSHLLKHLEKEENHCIPLVKEHFSHDEINELVGRIMGKRSSDVMIQILNLAVHTLPEEDREEMVTYMKQAMVGTFFERWLSAMGEWTNVGSNKQEKKEKKSSKKGAETPQNDDSSSRSTNDSASNSMSQNDPASPSTSSISSESPTSDFTPTPAELEKLIRTIALNPELTPIMKNTTIQSLRDSFYKSRKRKVSTDLSMSSAQNERGKRKKSTIDLSQKSSGAATFNIRSATQSYQQGPARDQRYTPPSNYFQKNENNEVELAWSSLSPKSCSLDGRSLPLFSASELAPTYHDGTNGKILGCPHYARSCKLRHPSSGRLYTCRLCCEQEREMPMKDKDSPLDRYSVKEILCMRCNTLQPSDNGSCINPNCEPKNQPFAKYHCKICNFFDDTPNKDIYHCPYCNVCRSGKGLGIDYYHCMRCNACVSLSDDTHVCIPQRLQGNCPICHESMFESIEPLRGLKCGHVMHLSCFSKYMRGQAYTCPLCKKSVEDMKEYFELLDSAVRMQPMPAAYASTLSSIYCQDCGKVGKVQYHFVGCKCAHCGSYNTREIERSEDAVSRGSS